MPGAGAAILILIVFVLSGLKVLREYERAVVFRLGRLVAARGPGVIYVIPGIERAIRVLVDEAQECVATRAKWAEYVLT